jgi:hypothetical protein
VLTQVTFEGYESWMNGTHGLYWVDTYGGGSDLVSRDLHIRDVRCESIGAAGYAAYISRSGKTLQMCSFRECHLGATNGLYLRGVDRATIENCFYSSGSLVGLDADSTVHRMSLQNNFWQHGSTWNLTGQRLLWALPKEFAGHDPYGTAEYVSTYYSEQPVVSEVALCVKRPIADNNSDPTPVLTEADYPSGSVIRFTNENAHPTLPALTEGLCYTLITSGAALTATSFTLTAPSACLMCDGQTGLKTNLVWSTTPLFLAVNVVSDGTYWFVTSMTALPDSSS